MLYFSSQFTLRAVGLALPFFAANAFAQTPHAHAAMPEAKPGAASASALRYESVFARYRSYRDEKTGSWRESNDTVDRIGGWRAYAKEAQSPESTAPAKANPHAGHGSKP